MMTNQIVRALEDLNGDRYLWRTDSAVGGWVAVPSERCLFRDGDRWPYGYVVSESETGVVTVTPDTDSHVGREIGVLSLSERGETTAARSLVTTDPYDLLEAATVAVRQFVDVDVDVAATIEHGGNATVWALRR